MMLASFIIKQYTNQIIIKFYLFIIFGKDK